MENGSPGEPPKGHRGQHAQQVEESAVEVEEEVLLVHASIHVLLQRKLVVD